MGAFKQEIFKQRTIEDNQSIDVYDLLVMEPMHNVDYNSVRTASSASNSSLEIGQQLRLNTEYYVNRAYMRFNVPGIYQNIVNAVLSVYTTTGGISLTVYAPTVPFSQPINFYDWNKVDFLTTYLDIGFSTALNGYTDFQLNQDAKDFIELNGYIELIVLSIGDSNGIAPVGLNGEIAGTTTAFNRPTLTLTY